MNRSIAFASAALAATLAAGALADVPWNLYPRPQMQRANWTQGGLPGKLPTRQCPHWSIHRLRGCPLGLTIGLRQIPCISFILAERSSVSRLSQHLDLGLFNSPESLFSWQAKRGAI